MPENSDTKTIQSFSDEWQRHDQSKLSDEEAQQGFQEYFSLFPWELIDQSKTGFDMVCGSGRWAKWVAPRVRHLYCIDPSEAIQVARKNLSDYSNITFLKASVSDNPIPPNSQDFGYSLGVLHHLPDTKAAIKSCVNLLKPGAPLLLYIYYALDNRPLIFRLIWRLSDFFRRGISLLPSVPKGLITDFIAVFVYYPLAKLASVVDLLGWDSSHLPLSYYRDRSFYTMRTDSRDRFGTPLERRYTQAEIAEMMIAAGLENINFANHAPYWCAIGYKQSCVE